MNKSPLNYLLTAAIGALFWFFAAILPATYLTDVTLASKYPEDLAVELQLIFGIGTILSVAFSCYWYFYGDREKVAGELAKAQTKWRTMLLLQFINAVILTLVVVFQNREEGIEPDRYGIYFAINVLLTFCLFWLTTFFFSPRTVQYIPLGK